MKKIKALIIVTIVNIIILSCQLDKTDSSIILDKNTLANLIADIYTENYFKIYNDRYEASSNNMNIKNIDLANIDLYSNHLDKIYQKYGTDKFALYKTYLYYLKDGDTNKINTLKEIYAMSMSIIISKQKDLESLSNN